MIINCTNVALVMIVPVCFLALRRYYCVLSCGFEPLIAAVMESAHDDYPMYAEYGVSMVRI